MPRPLSESQGYIDISKGSSADFNRLIKSFTTDITNVFNSTNENDSKIRLNQDVLIQENLFLHRKLKEVEEKVKTVEAAFDKVKGTSNSYKVYKTFHTLESIKTGENYHYDNDYGIITMGYEDAQAISISQYPKQFLKKNIDISVEYKTLNNLGEQVGPTHTTSLGDDPSLLNLIDRDDSTFWVKNIETDSTVSSIDFTVTINMPVRIIPNLFINSIGIKSHPIYSMTLKDIIYTDANNKNRLSLPTYPSDTVNDIRIPQSISQIDSLKFMFPTITTNKIELKFNQPYHIQYGDIRRFIIGFRNIELETISVSSEVAYFITELKIPNGSQYFFRVLEPKVIPIVEGTDYGDLIKHELLYTLSPDSQAFTFGSEISSNRDVVYIKTTIRRDGEIIPAFKGIEFSYLPK